MSWLRGLGVVLGRELGATFDSVIAYVYTIAGLLLVNSLFMNEFFLTRRLDMTPFFELLPPLFVFFLPALTMRLWSEERKTRTFEFLATLPLTGMQTTLAKFLSAQILLALFLLGTCPIVVMLHSLGDPDSGALLAGYLGAFLLGSSFLGFGLFVSSLTSDQIVAFVLSVLLGFVFVFIGHERVTAVLDGLAPELALGSGLADRLGALTHYEPFVRGLVELEGLVFFGALTVVFVWLTARSVEANRT
jgi:ABC-2 type transport system permease protein